MRRVVVFSAPAVKKIAAATPPVTPAQGTDEMNAHYAANLAKAARAGVASYASAKDWSAALDDLARQNQRPGEKYEQSYLRTVETNADGRAIYKMLTAAADSEMANIAKRRSAAGRPTDRTPVEIVGDASEELLAKMATEHAQREGVSFERAYTRVVETAEGAALFNAAMAR